MQERNFRFIILFVVVVQVLSSLTGCSRYKEIKITGGRIETVSMVGLRSINTTLTVGIDNPAGKLDVREADGELIYFGKVIGKVVVDPFTMKGRSVEIYHLNARMNLDEDISLYDVLMLLDKKFIDNCTVDVTVKGKLRSGLSKTVTKKDLPVKKLMKYAENKK
jgi:hypothetical protein